MTSKHNDHKVTDIRPVDADIPLLSPATSLSFIKPDMDNSPLRMSVKLEVTDSEQNGSCCAENVKEEGGCTIKCEPHCHAGVTVDDMPLVIMKKEKIEDCLLQMAFSGERNEIASKDPICSADRQFHNNQTHNFDVKKEYVFINTLDNINVNSNVCMTSNSA